MVYNPATDFLALWRNVAGQLSKLEMPGLDYVIAALARAGLFTLSVSATAPVANQSTTAWLQAAVPSYSGEGVLNLWNPVTSTYAPATAALFLDLLQATAGQNGVSWWTSTGGPPLNTIGNNGDFAVRLDAPNGIYGPKALGVWPATPVPGTANVLTSTELDNTFGGVEGQLIVRGASVWQSLALGPANSVLTPLAGLPAWEGLSALFDTAFGNSEGMLIYRDLSTWLALAPGTAGQVLSTNGAGAAPSWTARTAEFPSGTAMVFSQTSAPPGWTKQTAANDCALRLTSGTVGFTSGSAFSTVFAQTAVGNTTLSSAQIPAHTHNVLIPDFPVQVGAGTSGGGLAYSAASAATFTSDGGTGGAGAHSHTVNLALAYSDVIIASKN